MSDRTASSRPRAVLAAVELPDASPEETASSLDELARLVETLGLRPVARVVQRRRTPGAAALFGRGKLLELARLTGGTGVVPAGITRRPGKKTVHPWEVDEEPDDDEGALAPEPEFEAEAL